MSSTGMAGEMGPPSGCTFTELPDGFEVSATTRSIQRALFCSLWLMFSLLMVKAVIVGAEDVPFGVMAGGVVMLLVAVPLFPMSLAGRVTLTLRGDVLQVLIGVGGIGLRRNLQWSRVRKVEEFHMPGKSGSRQILVEGETVYRFGQWISDERRLFLLLVLQRELAKIRH